MIVRWWRRHRDAQVMAHRPIPDDLWLDTVRTYRFLADRPLADLLRLRELATLFLARKEFTAVGGLALTDEMAVAVAAQACVPVLHLGLEVYDGFVGIVMQPGEVVARREWMDEDGIVHEADEWLTGEAMPGGPVMLSWPDVADAGESASHGYNVVIHEFVHVIDMCDGQPADGVPPLPNRDAQQHWLDVMGAAHHHLAEAVSRNESTGLDPYGANGIEEFFPVASEAFFVAPRTLHSTYPAVYTLLRQFFRQDPLGTNPPAPNRIGA